MPSYHSSAMKIIMNSWKILVKLVFHSNFDHESMSSLSAKLNFDRIQSPYQFGQGKNKPALTNDTLNYGSCGFELGILNVRVKNCMEKSVKTEQNRTRLRHARNEIQSNKHILVMMNFNTSFFQMILLTSSSFRAQKIWRRFEAQNSKFGVIVKASK